MAKRMNGKHNWTNKNPEAKRKRKPRTTWKEGLLTSLGCGEAYWVSEWALFLRAALFLIRLYQFDVCAHFRDLTTMQHCQPLFLILDLSPQTTKQQVCSLKDGWMRPLALEERGQTVTLATLIFVLSVNASRSQTRINTVSIQTVGT